MAKTITKTRPVWADDLMATLICTCGHPRETHWYEKRRSAWTVCRACRCVRFTAEDQDRDVRLSRYG